MELFGIVKGLKNWLTNLVIGFDEPFPEFFLPAILDLSFKIHDPMN
jgi:hypothetical protein